MEAFCVHNYLPMKDNTIFHKSLASENGIMRFTRHNSVKYTIIIACIQNTVYLVKDFTTKVRSFGRMIADPASLVREETGTILPHISIDTFSTTCREVAR